MKKFATWTAALLAVVVLSASSASAAVTTNVAADDLTASFSSLNVSSTQTVSTVFGSFTLRSAVVDGSGANAGIRAYLYQVSVPATSLIHSVELYFPVPLTAATLPINGGAAGPVTDLSVNTTAGGSTRFNATLGTFGFVNNVPGGQAVDNFTADLLNDTITFTRINNFSNLTTLTDPSNSIIFGVFKSDVGNSPGLTSASVIVRDDANTVGTQVTVLAPALTALPEPSSMVLAGIGAFGLAMRTLRRRRAQA